MKRILVTVCLSAIIAGSAWALDVPKLTGPVNDYAGLLKSEQLQQLQAKLLAYEKATSNQIVVLIIPSLEGENEVAFGVKVFKAWKLGQKKKDNGVLWLHAVKERRNRLEVGYGLEGALPDATCLSILTQRVAPNFKAGQFFAGYISGIEAMMAATRGEYRPEKTDVATTGKDEESLDPRWLLLIVVFIIAAIGCAFHPLVGGIFGGLGSGYVGLLIYGPIGAVIFGIIGFLVGLVAKDIAESSGSSSSSGGSYSSSSSSGGGGYSGGGGSSGGGGASAGY